MDNKFQILLLLLSSVVLIRGQNTTCRPGRVTNLALSGNSTLTWEPPINENCEILYYVVRVSVLSTDEAWSYTVTERTLDVGHLTPCLRYYFEVGQVSSDNVTGAYTTMNIVTPPPADANLALDYVRLQPQGRNVLLEWALEDDWATCAQRYRVVIVNEDSNAVSDVYTTSPSVTIVGLTPCASYTFAVRALFTLEDEGPITLVTHVASEAQTTVPTLRSISLGTTNVALTVGLQTLEQNRCPIYSINISGTPSFNATFSVDDQNNRNNFSANLTGLQADTMYYVRITANNTAGVTNPFHFAVQTLESD